MASSYRPAGSRGPQNPHAQNMVVPVGISACVGHDNWASDVIHSVVSNKGSSSGSTSPESSHSPVLSGYDVTDKYVHPVDPVVLVRQKVRDRKRKFHSGRPLELKNLPDNCNEQVGQLQLHDYRIHPAVQAHLNFYKWPSIIYRVLVSN